MKLSNAKLSLIFYCILFCGVVICQSATIPESTPVVLRTIPHDPSAFTQGLLYYKGFLYESTGLYNQSSLRCIDPKTGQVVKNVPVPDVFAEGLCRMDSVLVQLTWKENAAIKYSFKNLAVKGSYSYKGEGWGLTTSGSSFIMSNGSDSLYIRNKQFTITKAVAVTQSGKPLTHLNELEYAKHLVYANVWFDNNIYAIDLKTGAVVKIINCNSLVAKNASQSDQDVLNGIAYNDNDGTFFVTGKNWRYIFEVRF